MHKDQADKQSHLNLFTHLLTRPPMCGISGLLHFDNSRSANKDTLQRMTDSLAHRGPDGEGYFVDKNVALGHKRLSVIDLSTGGQPMMSADKKVVIVFNGEIYNYIELREELATLGQQFYTSSDTEVILNAYKQWGFECQNKLNGMWAFAIWDIRERQLLLSRDRLGEKPLHYSIRDNSIFFGSEVKSILASGQIYEKETELLHIYLSLGYVPAPFTFYKGIYKLTPGHFLLVREGKVEAKSYWALPDIDEDDMRTDEDRICEEFEATFHDSVRIRMRSDVPYGAFLSGGLDSSSVVAAMSVASPLPIKTFTIGFAEHTFDERSLAKQVAERFQTIHYEQLANPETFDESLRRILFQFDEPFGDASAIPVGLVSRLARQKVTMVLTGDGGDEVLSGYTSYLAEKLSEQYRMVPMLARDLLTNCLESIAAVGRDDVRYKLNRLLRLLALSGKPFEDRFVSKLSMLDRGTISKLIPSHLKQVTIDDFVSEFFGGCRFKDPFYRLMCFNLMISLPDDMLAKVDRMSMAYALEARVPFLDYRLVELGYATHKSVKLSGYSLKNILRRTLGRQLPPSILRAPKMPFSVPLREWFKQSTFDERLRELGNTDFGLNGHVIREIVVANKVGEGDYGDFIWRLFVLKNWMAN